MALVGQMNRKPAARRERCRSPIQRGSLGHKRKVRDQFAAAPQLACEGDTLQFRVRLSQAAFRGFKQERRPVHVAASFAAAQDREVPQNLRLQRASQPFHGLEAVLVRGLTNPAREMIPSSL